MDSMQTVEMKMNNERVLSAAENIKSTFISFSGCYSRSDYGFNFQFNSGKSRKLLIFTLTGHFIQSTSLVLGWTPFALRPAFISSWYRPQDKSSELHLHNICRIKLFYTDHICTVKSHNVIMYHCVCLLQCVLHTVKELFRGGRQPSRD